MHNCKIPDKLKQKQKTGQQQEKRNRKKVKFNHLIPLSKMSFIHAFQNCESFPDMKKIEEKKRISN